MRVELHILQSFPYANLNRDDTGAPKDCEFGGERRARLSSQCLKRAIRTHPRFAAGLDGAVGIRTKRGVTRVAERLVSDHGLAPAHARMMALAAFEALLSAGAVNEQRDDQTNVLIYAAPAEFDALAAQLADAYAGGAQTLVEAALSDQTASAAVPASTDTLDFFESPPVETAEAPQKGKKGKKGKNDATPRGALRDALAGPVGQFVSFSKGQAHAVDVGLFGRMLAEKPDLNLEAACQVAHALSTHRMDLSFDYFTAVDDLNPGDETGAGMIGSTGHTSACYYRYALVDVDALARRLGGLSLTATPTPEARTRALDGVRAFLDAAIYAVPTGKQNSTAPQARPDFVMTVVREGNDAPMSLVNAFESPVPDLPAQGYVAASVSALARYHADMRDMYEDTPSAVFVATTHGNALNVLAEHRVPNVRTLLENTVATLGGETQL